MPGLKFLTSSTPELDARRQWLRCAGAVTGAALLSAGWPAVAAAASRDAEVSPAATAGCDSSSATNWPLWAQFAATYVQPDGRVVDYSVPQMHSTSEGQSYCMFFALVANDPVGFDRLWRWAVANLAGGDISARLPAWQWGKREDGRWGVMDTNPASDADLWFAYALLEAARIWKKPAYRDDALALLKRVKAEEVSVLPGFGPMLLPGPTGFNLPGRVWRLNPSYLPLPLLRRFAHEDAQGPWNAVASNTQRLLAGASANGFIADWVAYEAPMMLGSGRFVADPAKGDLGSYDAIRCYLWAGMTAPQDPLRAASLQSLNGMRRALANSGGMVPEKIAVLSGQTSGSGPIGFSAALLPYLKALADEPLYRSELVRVRNVLPEHDVVAELPVYYDMMLSLFGLGWVEGRYRFRADGRLQLPKAPC